MFSRVGRPIALVATFIIVGALGGCAESSQPVATGKGDIRAINAVVTAPEIGFLIEETSLGGMNYKATTAFNKYDDLTYNFNFDMFLPGENDPVRVAIHSLKVVKDQRHTIVLTGTIANPVTLDWEDPARSWADSDTVTELIFAHLAPSVDKIDIYFALTGTQPIVGQDVGSLSNGNRLDPMDFEADEYELILTAAGDPATVLFHSIPIAIAPRTNITIAVFDPDPSITPDMAVSLITIGGVSSAIPDVNFRGQLRLLHGAFGVENFDGFLEDNFNDIVYPDMAFQELSAYAETPRFSNTVTLTPVGNSGATILEEEVNVSRTTKLSAILGGTLADPFLYRAVDDARPLETAPVVRVINLSINVAFVNLYVLDPGTPIDEVLIPTVPLLRALSDTGFFGIPDGPQEMTITAIGESAPIAPPIEVDVAAGDILDIIILDTVDPNVLEILVFDRQ
jgi:hypothetical protein